jgi:hypothetical protein
MQGFPETRKLFQVFLQGKNIEKRWTIAFTEQQQIDINLFSKAWQEAIVRTDVEYVPYIMFYN